MKFRIIAAGVISAMGLSVGTVAGASGTPPTATVPVLTSSTQVAVNAATYLTGSGVKLGSDQYAVVTATGSADVCGDGCPSGPNGATNGDLGTNVQGAPAGLLYYNQTGAKVTGSGADGVNIPVGTGPVTISTPGEIYFGLNDGSYYGDNSGSYTVTVDVYMVASFASCKNGGWSSYGVFKNQGDCVSFVATNGMNLPG